MVSNIERKKFALNVRRDGPQPSICVRPFRSFTTRCIALDRYLGSSFPGVRAGMTFPFRCYELISCRWKATKLPTTKTVIHSSATSKAAA